MTDIVERLRDLVCSDTDAWHLCGEAADELERLREALRDFACWCDENECQEYDDVGLRYCCYRNKSRAALGEGK